MGKLMKRNENFGDFFIFSIISLIAGVKFANIQIALESQPLGVERWLSPFASQQIRKTQSVKKVLVPKCTIILRKFEKVLRKFLT